MKRPDFRRLWLALAFCCVANAQSVFDLDDWMQRIDDQSQDLQRHIAARDASAATASARELEELYGRMETFFDQRGTRSRRSALVARGARVRATRAGRPCGSALCFCAT